MNETETAAGEVPVVQTATHITRQHLKTWGVGQVKQYGDIPANQQYLLDIWAHMDVAIKLGI